MPASRSVRLSQGSDFRFSLVVADPALKTLSGHNAGELEWEWHPHPVLPRQWLESDDRSRGNHRGLHTPLWFLHVGQSRRHIYGGQSRSPGQGIWPGIRCIPATSRPGDAGAHRCPRQCQAPPQDRGRPEDHLDSKNAESMQGRQRKSRSEVSARCLVSTGRFGIRWTPLAVIEAAVQYQDQSKGAQEVVSPDVRTSTTRPLS